MRSGGRVMVEAQAGAMSERARATRRTTLQLTCLAAWSGCRREPRRQRRETAASVDERPDVRRATAPPERDVYTAEMRSLVIVSALCACGGGGTPDGTTYQFVMIVEGSEIGFGSLDGDYLPI